MVTIKQLTTYNKLYIPEYFILKDASNCVHISQIPILIYGEELYNYVSDVKSNSIFYVS